jgi:hypothetical protein
MLSKSRPRGIACQLHRRNTHADLVAINKFMGDSMAANPLIESALDVVAGTKIVVGTAKSNPDLVKALRAGLTAIHAAAPRRRANQIMSVAAWCRRQASAACKQREKP